MKKTCVILIISTLALMSCSGGDGGAGGGEGAPPASVIPGPMIDGASGPAATPAPPSPELEKALRMKADAGFQAGDTAQMLNYCELADKVAGPDTAKDALLCSAAKFADKMATFGKLTCSKDYSGSDYINDVAFLALFQSYTEAPLPIGLYIPCADSLYVNFAITKLSALGFITKMKMAAGDMTNVYKFLREFDLSDSITYLSKAIEISPADPITLDLAQISSLGFPSDESAPVAVDLRGLYYLRTLENSLNILINLAGNYKWFDEASLPQDPISITDDVLFGSVLNNGLLTRITSGTFSFKTKAEQLIADVNKLAFWEGADRIYLPLPAIVIDGSDPAPDYPRTRLREAATNLRCTYYHNCGTTDPFHQIRAFSAYKMSVDHCLNNPPDRAALTDEPFITTSSGWGPNPNFFTVFLSDCIKPTSTSAQLNVGDMFNALGVYGPLPLASAPTTAPIGATIPIPPAAGAVPPVGPPPPPPISDDGADPTITVTSGGSATTNMASFSISRNITKTFNIVAGDNSGAVTLTAMVYYDPVAATKDPQTFGPFSSTASGNSQNKEFSYSISGGGKNMNISIKNTSLSANDVVMLTIQAADGGGREAEFIIVLMAQ